MKVKSLKYILGTALLLSMVAESSYAILQEIDYPSKRRKSTISGSRRQSIKGKFAFIGKSCDKKILVSPTYLSEGDEQTKCLAAPPQNAKSFDSKTFITKLNQKLTEVSTRLDATMQDLDDIDKDALDIISAYMNDVNAGSSKTKDFYAHINPDVIRFMFALCVHSYYDKNFSLNPNNVSIRYQKLINQQKATVENLEARLTNINRFKTFMNKSFGEDLIAQLKKKRLESEKLSEQEQESDISSQGKQEQHFGVETTNVEGKSSFKHGQGGEYSGIGRSKGMGKEQARQRQSEVEDIEIKSLAPDFIKAFAKQYNSLFDQEKITITEDLTLSQIEERVARLELETKNQLLEAKQSLEVLSDKTIGDFWAKLDMIFDRQADGFMPIDVLYRSLTPYKTPIIGAGLAKSKKNPKTDLGGKEFSGIMMYKPDESGQSKKTDELIFAFSGSNSEEDWKHNLDGLAKEGVASVNLAAGLKVHKGIMSSLEESLKEAGTKLKEWFRSYSQSLKKNDENKPTLKIYLTGHSLGGALAMLMAVYVKQNIEPYMKDYANIEIIVYTFGAPPIFHKESANEVEAMLGKNNIIRVWNIGDPVANLSIFKKTEEVFKRSPLMVLLGYKHVGLSVPLYDNKKMASFFDKFHPWANHLSNRYNNLIVTNWKDILNREANQVYGIIIQKGLSKDQAVKKSLEEIIQFTRYPSESPTLMVNSISAEDIDQIISKTKPEGPVEKKMKNYPQIQEERYQQGEKSAPKLGKAETKQLNYTHELLTGHSVKMSLQRNTSCDFNAIAKQAKLNAKQFGADDKNELSCGCCLSKNFFVSFDQSITSKLRGLFGKKISTVQQIYDHCQKYCKPLQGKIFPKTKQVDVNAIGTFMEERLGLGEQWAEKKLK
jgi:hypothetical protein